MSKTLQHATCLGSPILNSKDMVSFTAARDAFPQTGVGAGSIVFLKSKG